MNYTITEVLLDIANNYRVRVMLDENSTEFFNFDHYPTQEEINNTVDSYKQSLTN
jgi:hypothetical protein